MNAKRTPNSATAATATDSRPETDLSFEAAQAELEQIVRDMEAGEAARQGTVSAALSLEASLKSYQRGMLLLRHCQQQLADAEARVRLLEDDGSLRPLAAAPESP